MPITPKSLKSEENKIQEGQKSLKKYLQDFDHDPQEESFENPTSKNYDPKILEKNGLRISKSRENGPLSTYKVEMIHSNGEWKPLAKMTYNQEDHSISGPISGEDPKGISKIKNLVRLHHEHESNDGENIDELGDFLMKIHSGEHNLTKQDPGLKKSEVNYHPLGASQPKIEVPKTRQQRDSDDFDDFMKESLSDKPWETKAPVEPPRPKSDVGGVQGNPYAISIKRSDGSLSQHKMGDVKNVLGNPNHPNHVSIKGSKLSGYVLKTPEGHEVRIHHPGLLGKITNSLGGVK